MKKITSLLVVTFAFLSLGVLTQCDNNICNCPEVKKPFLELNAIRLTNVDRLSGVGTTNGVDLAYVTYKDLFVRLSTLISLTADVNQNKKMPNLSINSVLACECGFEGQNGFKNKLQSISVFLLTDYDENFKKGALFNEKIKITNQFNSFQNFTTTTFIDEFNNVNNAFGQNFGFEVNHTTEFLNKLSQSSNELPFAIEVKFTMEDGTIFTAQSSEIILKK